MPPRAGAGLKRNHKFNRIAGGVAPSDVFHQGAGGIQAEVFPKAGRIIKGQFKTVIKFLYLNGHFPQAVKGQPGFTVRNRGRQLVNIVGRVSGKRMKFQPVGFQPGGFVFVQCNTVQTVGKAVYLHAAVSAVKGVKVFFMHGDFAYFYAGQRNFCRGERIFGI